MRGRLVIYNTADPYPRRGNVVTRLLPRDIIIFVEFTLQLTDADKVIPVSYTRFHTVIARCHENHSNPIMMFTLVSQIRIVDRIPKAMLVDIYICIFFFNFISYIVMFKFSCLFFLQCVI